MTGSDPEAAVREILQTALREPTSALADPSTQDFEHWDSLTHIEIVFLLEERFGVRFSDEEVRTLTSLSAIMAALAAKRAT